MPATKIALGYISEDDTRPATAGLYRIIAIEGGIKLLASEEANDLILEVMPQQVAPTSNPTFAGLTITSGGTLNTIGVTVLGLTKATVGLGNVDNTSDVNKPVSSAQQTALNLKFSSIQVSTYAAMIALPPVSVQTIVKVTEDEKHGISNAFFLLYPGGLRIWLAATEDL